ncbi:MAG: DUF4294 domain-containing protein [Bacteroidales bacterium]|nr:DUF4294 domain-containing protein [Bacteroidales bacterium]MBP5614077.1 DUF4294 domain-containing protein [Bacteroidales bacterium]
MKKALFLPLLFLLLYGSTAAQKTEGPIVCRATVEGKDTILLFDLKPYNVIDFKGNLSQKEIRRKTRLMNNIIRVYPYARMAAVKLREYDSLLVSIPNDEQRKKTMKQVEKAFVKQYTPIVEDLSFNQGIVLLKLIDRETGKTTYRIVDELRGKITAFFYQSIARLWHYNLKDHYDPNGRDAEIESIVRMIETGKIII